MVYASAGILAILISLIINHDVLLNKEISHVKTAEQSYRMFLMSVIAYYITDALWGILYGRRLIEFTFFDTTLYFLAMAASVLFWTRFVVSYLNDDKSFGKVLTAFGWVFFGFTSVMLLLNFFSPVFFSLNSAGEYKTGIVRQMIMCMQVIMFLATGGFALKKADRSSGNVRFRHFTVGLLSLAMAGFVIAQIYYPLLPMYAIGQMITCCLLHSFVIEKERMELNARLEKEQNENSRLSKELESQSDLTELMSSMTSLLVNMPAMTFSKDMNTGKYLAGNQAFADYAGVASPDELIGKTDYELFDKVTADSFIENDKTTINMDEPYVYYEDVPDTNGSAIRNLQTTKQVFTDATGRKCILGLCVDVTETARIKAEQAATEARQQEIQKKNELEESYKKHVEELSFRASHDELTGVYNRLGYDHMVQKVDLSECFFILFDSDDFKTINDTYGHEIGDKVLIKISSVLKNNFRADDYIFRIGGDEFVVIMSNVPESRKSMVAEKIERINRELAEEREGIPSISLSAGIVHGNGIDDNELFGRADQAMYEAKRGGKKCYMFK